MRVRRGPGLVATAALALLLGACSEPTSTDPDPAPVSEASTSPEPTDEPSSSPSVPVADPAHAVDPPGERDGRLWSADILVQWDRPLDAGLVKAIGRLKGVAHTERIGL